MKKILEFLSRKGRELIENNYDARCLNIAEEVAVKLLEEGVVPQIEEVMEEVREKRIETLKPFRPLNLDRITWYIHFVCCTEDMAYEPLLERPVPKHEYCKLMFGEDIEMSVRVPKNEIKDYVRFREERK